MLVWSKNAIFGVDCVTSANGKPSSSAEWWSQDCINTDTTNTWGTETETEKKGLEWTGHHHLHKLYNRRTMLRCIGIINIPMHLTGCIWRRACHNNDAVPGPGWCSRPPCQDRPTTETKTMWFWAQSLVRQRQVAVSEIMQGWKKMFLDTLGKTTFSQMFFFLIVTNKKR